MAARLRLWAERLPRQAGWLMMFVGGYRQTKHQRAPIIRRQRLFLITPADNLMAGAFEQQETYKRDNTKMKLLL
jgi:hypothetical protein